MMRERGMTLIEVIVAMFIVMVMMTFLIPIYLRTMKVKSRTEEIAALTARGRGAMGVLRRDLGGAFRTAVNMYDFRTTTEPTGAHRSGREFHWEAPVVAGSPASGFRRLTFVGAVDGSRVNGDPMRDLDYARVSWALKGTLQRSVTALSISKLTTGGSAWMPPASPARPDVALVTDNGGAFDDAGAFRGAPYLEGIGASASTIRLYGQILRGRFTFSSVGLTVSGVGTKFLNDIDAGDYIMGGKDGAWTRVASVESDVSLTLAAPYVRDDSNTVGLLKVPISVTATVCLPDTVTPLPDWLELEWKRVAGRVAKGGVTYDLYSRFCPAGGVTVGENTTGFFIIVEPGWWSLGEEAEDLVFYPPAGYAPTLDPATGVYKGGVPRYIDVRLKISDPDFVGDGTSPGARTFCERVAIPAGVLP